MKKYFMVVFAAFSVLMGSSYAKADQAVVPVVSVGGAIYSNCALLTVPAGDFNAAGVLAIDVSTPGGQAAYATAMLAFSMGRHIWVNRVSQPAGCYSLTDYASDIRVQSY